ncbi:MAG: hypothetical protein BGO88_08720 [Flavobacterium sp. 38-13]|nr:MAG: hypothetical protein BGO88_08720 [Flavobacterium sp. 38-13]
MAPQVFCGEKREKSISRHFSEYQKLKNGRAEDRPAIQVTVQIGVEGVGTLVGQRAFYRNETEIKYFLKKQDMAFGSHKPFFFGLIAIVLRRFGKLLHQMTLTVTFHFGLVFVNTEHRCDVIVINGIFDDWKHGLQEHKQCEYGCHFFHSANLQKHNQIV